MYFQFKDKYGIHHKINLLGDRDAAVRHLEQQGCYDIRSTNFVYTGE